MTKKKHTLVPLKDTIASLLSDSILPFNPGGAQIFQDWKTVWKQVSNALMDIKEEKYLKCSMTPSSIKRSKLKWDILEESPCS
jgi:hypothetical protein